MNQKTKKSSVVAGEKKSEVSSSTNHKSQSLNNSKTTINNKNQNSQKYSSLIISIIALIFAIAAIAGTYWAYQEKASAKISKTDIISEINQKIDQDLQELQNADQSIISSVDQINQTLASSQDQTTKMQDSTTEKINAIKHELSEQINASNSELLAQNQELQNANSALQERIVSLENAQKVLFEITDEIPSQKILWKLMDIVQLQKQALRFIEINKEPQAALVALEKSIVELNQLDFDGQAKFIEKTQSAIVDVRNQNENSVGLISQEIASIGRTIKSQPMRQQTEVEDESNNSEESISENNNNQATKPWYQQFGSDMLKEAKSLVQIYPEDYPLVPPGGEFFIRENLALSIETMRYAAITRNSNLMGQEISKINQWVDTYFLEDDNLEKIKERLNKIEKTKLDLDSSKLTELIQVGELLVDKFGGQK